MLSVRIWGDRGSIPCPGKDTVIYGGNTSCLEIRADEKLVIVDLGTGVRLLGDWLMENDYKKGPIDADIFITHTHWDHIMGFPMFSPIFVPTTRFRIRGPVSYEDETLEQIIGAQLSYRYWPVRIDELAADIEYSRIQETSFDLGGGLRVTTKYLNHPILCLGYRFEYQGKSIVTAYDHEPFRNLFPTDPSDPSFDEDIAREGEAAAADENEKILRFFHGADILIQDSQYTAEEYPRHTGWGHSTFEYALASAEAATAKKIILFHHDPGRTDAQLEELERSFQARAAARPEIQLIAAREGLTIEA
ncbi:MAG: MBL fold metallo-hydrolase [Treponema sp.]|jgi:phosphoribosyl 1,2-cyclic phosphodiesterase|nr:MBL fold metallo-hydrolase [Treponema sp.]